ncbi:MAG: hypothetical protein ABIJ61_02905, partial [bacterium]
MKLSQYMLLALVGLLLIPAAAMADDPGERDTVRVVYTETDPGVDAAVPVTIFNDENVGGFSLGFSWDSPDITVDSVSFVGSRATPFFAVAPVIDNANQTVLTGWVDFTGALPLTPGDGLVLTIWFHVPPSTPDQFVYLDSTFIPPAGTFVLSLISGGSASPEYQGNFIKIGDPPPPPVIDLSGTSFVFNAEIGGGNPTSQILNITHA